MNKFEAKELFQEQFGEETIKRLKQTDKPALREAWNDFTDALCKAGAITEKQYDSWTNPFLIER